MAERLETIHHPDYDRTIFSPYVPAIKVHGGTLVFISGVTAAPVYHDHPHRSEVFDAVPRDIDGQVPLVFEHLEQALRAAGCDRTDVVSLTRFFTHVEDDQDAVNRLQAEWFRGSHTDEHDCRGEEARDRPTAPAGDSGDRGWFLTPDRARPRHIGCTHRRGGVRECRHRIES